MREPIPYLICSAGAFLFIVGILMFVYAMRFAIGGKGGADNAECTVAGLIASFGGGLAVFGYLLIKRRNSN